MLLRSLGEVKKKKNRIEYLVDRNSEALRHKSMILKNDEEHTGGAALDYSFKKFNFWKEEAIWDFIMT